jgi:hypothetical protein
MLRRSFPPDTRRANANLLTRAEARRIALNITELPAAQLTIKIAGPERQRGPVHCRAFLLLLRLARRFEQKISPGGFAHPVVRSTTLSV